MGRRTRVHSGVAHNVAGDPVAALALVRRFLSYLPSNAWQCRRRHRGRSRAPRRSPELLDLVPPNPRRPYDMRAVLEVVLDAGSYFEIQPGTGRGDHRARPPRRPAVAVVANQPRVRAGAIDVAAAEKAARFIQFADAFHLPLLLVADNPGVLPGSASERAGILRAAARMFAAQHAFQGPKLHLTVRKAFGFGSSVMGMNAFDRQTVSLALPGVTIGGIPAAVGGATAKEDESTRQALVAQRSRWAMAVGGLGDLRRRRGAAGGPQRLVGRAAVGRGPADRTRHARHPHRIPAVR